MRKTMTKGKEDGYVTWKDLTKVGVSVIIGVLAVIVTLAVAIKSDVQKGIDGMVTKEAHCADIKGIEKAIQTMGEAQTDFIGEMKRLHPRIEHRR